jgi:hypothetical protein
MRDGNWISGQNPASNAPAAKFVLEALGENGLKAATLAVGSPMILLVWPL